MLEGAQVVFKVFAAMGDTECLSFKNGKLVKVDVDKLVERIWISVSFEITPKVNYAGEFMVMGKGIKVFLGCMMKRIRANEARRVLPNRLHRAYRLNAGVVEGR